MRVIFSYALLLVALGLVLLIAGSTVWRLAFRWGESLPGDDTIPALSAQAHIAWGESGTIDIEAEDLSDAVRALGYAHAMQHAWTMALWRQAAFGKLSAWFGGGAFAADRIARQLGFAALARVVADSLETADYAFLEAYADGVNAAWPKVHRKHEFLLLDVSTEPWLAWHSLAIERLLAWLSESPSEACPALPSVCESDEILRSLIQVYGLEYSAAWITNVTGLPAMYQRHVVGASALPVLQEASIRISGQQPLFGASILGTPFFPAAKRDTAAWSVLLSSPRTVVRSLPLRPQYERITFRNGEERLIEFARQRGLLTVDTATTALSWSGLQAASDAPAWHALLRGDSASFQLLRGDGLYVHNLDTWEVIGAPAVLHTVPGGVLIGNAPEAGYMADYLMARSDRMRDVEVWQADAYSVWAADTLSQMLASLDELPSSQIIRNAFTYLRNWDFAFDGHSIGAAIFSEWIRTGVPVEQSAQGLQSAVEILVRRFGEDLSQWRWERVHPERRHFTVYPWSHEAARFAPLEWPGSGHGTSFMWGGTLLGGSSAPPATWEMWTDFRPAGRVHVRKRHIDPHRPLGRYIAEQAHPVVLQLPVSTRSTTTLHP